MEVHGINSYGEDPRVSTGTSIFLKYHIKESVSISPMQIK
jgi:hypothetical protein